MLTNNVNADSFLYEFDSLFGDTSATHHLSPEIAFLSRQIDVVSFRRKLAASLTVVEKALNLFDTSQLCVAFNGGKDCCVVFYLFYAVCLRAGVRFPLKVLLIQINHQFEEMSVFVQQTLKSFYTSETLELLVFDEDEANVSLKECLRQMKQTHPLVRGILMGTRRTDSAYFRNMEAFAPTDGDWPSYTRVNPILDWSYSEVWYFIRVLKLPYCSLYDRGYTSVDNTLNTVPNQDLCRADGTFMPAYWLEDQDAERKSRCK